MLQSISCTSGLCSGFGRVPPAWMLRAQIKQQGLCKWILGLPGAIVRWGASRFQYETQRLWVANKFTKTGFKLCHCAYVLCLCFPSSFSLRFSTCFLARSLWCRTDSVSYLKAEAFNQVHCTVCRYTIAFHELCQCVLLCLDCSLKINKPKLTTAKECFIVYVDDALMN